MYLTYLHIDRVPKSEVSGAVAGIMAPKKVELVVSVSPLQYLVNCVLRPFSFFIVRICHVISPFK